MSRRFQSQSRSLCEPTQATPPRETRRRRDDHVKGEEDWECQDLPNPAGEMDRARGGGGGLREPYGTSSSRQATGGTVPASGPPKEAWRNLAGG